MADNKIESVLREDRQFDPPQAFVESATLKPADVDALRKAAADDHEGFWAEQAREKIDWHKPFTQVLDESDAPFFKWFADGELNVSYNCLDRHLDTRGDKTAIIFEGDDGEVEHISYRELHARVCRFANALKSKGLGKGDRAVIYLPNIPQAAVAMLACARIGAIHSVVFGGFSAVSLRDRIDDAEAKMLITADGNYRGGKLIPLKETADKALSEGCKTIETVMVYKRSGAEVLITGTRASASDYEHDLSDFDYHSLQLTDSENLESLAAGLGSLDVLVNNAGANLPGGRNEWEPDVFEEVVTINLTSAFRLAVACKPLLAQSGLEAGGCVVNLASMSSFFAVPVVPGYGAAKAGIVQMTKNLAVTWAAEGIRVNAVAPSLTDTSLAATLLGSDAKREASAERHPLKKVLSADEVASAAAYLVSEHAAGMTGQVLQVDAGMGSVR